MNQQIPLDPETHTDKGGNKKTYTSENIRKHIHQPSNAFIAISWLVLFAGVISYIIGLWNADMMLNEKGYYFTVLMYGLFSAVSVQKSVRDKLEGIPVTDIYYGISWFSAILAVLLLVIGLWNASLSLSEKGFYGMSFTLSLFAAIAVQKNTRDSQNFAKNE